MDPDAKLVRRLKSGDPDALEDLFRVHGGAIHRVCRQVLRDEGEAEDVTHDVLLRVLERVDRYGGRARFRTWLHRLTVNACLHRVEKRRLRAAGPLSGEAEALVDGEPTPLEATLRGEAHSQLEDALDRLPLEHRLALHLREVEGLSCREIAVALDVPRGTVMSRLHRAREKLAAWLGAPRAASSSPQIAPAPLDPSCGLDPTS